MNGVDLSLGLRELNLSFAEIEAASMQAACAEPLKLHSLVIFQQWKEALELVQATLTLASVKRL